MLWLVTVLSVGCTSVTVKPNISKVPHAVGRTMELAESKVLKWSYAMHPRGEEWIGGDVKWTSIYGFVSIEAPLLMPEGMNEVGLTASALTQRDAVYQNATTGAPSMPMNTVLQYVLGTCRTLSEVVEKIDGMSVTADNDKNPQYFVHWTFTDAGGSSYVLEYLKGMRYWYKNTVGVLTNDPGYQWHVDNLRNYVALSPTLGKAWDIVDKVIPNPEDLSFGTNLLGLPGDLSPPARFVRMFYLRAFSQAKRPLFSATDVLILLQNLLSTVTIVKGTVNKQPRSVASPSEATHWATIKFPTLRLLYFRTYDNHQWRLIDFNALNMTTAWSYPLDDGSLGVRNITAAL